MGMPASRRLKIGLSACFQHADPSRSLFTGKTLQYVEQSVAHWIMSAGAMVVMVPCPTGETARGDVTLAHYADWLDGVVMHGGADVWPGSYGEAPLRAAWEGDRVRDLYDLAVVEAFAQAGKPIFGICRGLQLINVAFGGSLYQDIETQRPGALQHRNASTYDQNFHDVEFVPGSRLAQLYPGVRRARVNSIHHQGIKRLAPDFEIEAFSHPDVVPEAIRRRPAPGPRLHRRHPVAPRVPPARRRHARRHCDPQRLPGRLQRRQGAPASTRPESAAHPRPRHAPAAPGAAAAPLNRSAIYGVFGLQPLLAKR